MRWLKLSLVAAVVMIGVGQVRAVPEQDESLGSKIKKLFATPTPRPHKKHKASPSPSSSSSPKKKSSPKPSPSPKRSPVPSETPEATSSPTASATPSETPAETPRRRKLSDPVRAISPGPKRRHLQTPPDGVSIPSPHETKTPAMKTPTPTPSPTPVVASTPSASKGTGTHAQVATITSSEIVGYANYPAEVRQLLDRALRLTTENLDYKYGSADPANGGMDCSGFINYVLAQSGMKDVPRDARDLYVWVRKAGNFQAVLGQGDDTFELDQLKPGDLLFWSGTYHTDHDPAITHTMIYLGREKGTNQRIMVGSSDGRSYKGQSRFGVSVFDFKVASRQSAAKSEDHLTPTFVGYGRIPRLKVSE